jgi:tape measure domain-containing protein
MADPRARIVLTAEDQTRAAFGSVQANLKDMQRSLSQIRNVGAAVFGSEIVQSLGNGAKAVLEARIQFEKLNNVLGQAVGTAKVAAELTFIRDAASRLGLEFQSTAAAYAKFAAASRGTALEGGQTRDIFTGIAQASAALGLSSEETAGALTAVQQIISKGKVSAEELRGQLGERLPGAFQIAARSIGVTTQELDALLVSGNLLADDFLPKFARQLSIEFADSAAKAATSTQASFNKIETAYGDLKKTLASGPIGDAAAAGLTNLGTNLENLATRFRDAESASKGLFDRLANFAPPIGLTGILLGLGAQQRAADGEASRQELDRLTRRAGELPPQVPRGTVSQIRGIDNRALAGLQAESGADLRKLLQGLRTPEQQQRDQIAELRRLGGLTGQDVSGGIAEIQRRAAASAPKPKDTGADAYIKGLREQFEALNERTALEKVRAEIADGRLTKATAAQRLDATVIAAQIDDQKRLNDEASTYLKNLERTEEVERKMAEVNEREQERLKDLADSYRDLIDPTRKYLEKLEEIRKLEESGKLRPQEARAAEFEINSQLDDAISTLPAKVEQANDAARELGLTFQSAFEDAVIAGKGLSEVLRGLGQDLLRLTIRKTVTEPLANVASGALGGLFKFADGGIMTSSGALPLRKYAGGGVASSPQLAMFGEGSMNEAFVPLPDGRSIPVTVRGAGGVTLNQSITMGQGNSRGDAIRLGAVIKADTIRAIREAEARGAA